MIRALGATSRTALAASTVRCLQLRVIGELPTSLVASSLCINMQRSIYVLPPRPGVVEEPKTNEEVNALEEKLRDEAHDAFNHYTPQFRLPTPDTPESFLETWVSAKYVSPKSDENILKFQIFFAMDATKDLGRGSNKVVMTVETEQLPLKPHERRRLEAVAGQRYNHKKKILKLVCRRFEEPHRNKAEIRRILNEMLADARENGEAHLRAEQEDPYSLPIAFRSPYPSENWLKGTFGVTTRTGKPYKWKKPIRARTSKP
mmetsp:Transcript_37725/g.83051  ORF Transcript_37725/g.83051 Transcript_37725/m.83051 type:complete len:260 (+) Transcript_37725:135-914(+)